MQTRRTTRRSLALEQGVENDLSNRVSSRNANAASGALAGAKPAAIKPTVTVGTRRTAATGKLALADKVRRLFLLPIPTFSPR
jgi:hypothetical protein